jgi:hypothetical protein
MKTSHLLAGILCLAVSSFAHAQLSIGPQLGLAKHLGVGKNLTFGLRGEYNLTDNVNVVASFNYYLPSNIQDEDYVDDLNGGGSMSVDVQHRMTGYNLNIGLKKYIFGAEYEDDFGAYLMAGAGISILPYKSTITTAYDASRYSPRSYLQEGNNTDMLAGFTINAGMGAELMLGDNFAFGEMQLMIPATNVNGEEVDVAVPVTLAITIGYRFAL